MKRLTIEKTVLTVVLVACYILMPVTGYTNSLSVSEIPNHFTYMFCHANVWHLAGNLFVLWILKRRLYLLPAVVIGFVCSFLPSDGLWPLGITVGFSGVLFAIVGIKWGVYCRSFSYAGWLFEKGSYEEFCMKALPFALIGFIIPHVNWCLHLYCLLAGFLFGRFWHLVRA